MRNEIIHIIQENLKEIIPELEGKEVSIEDSFVDMGANSVDRGELITLTLERLNLNISRIEFVRAQTISELADLIIEKK